MKLTSLHIDSYRHLQNIHFDFTYPKGHVNAGKPLSKICIIGQSATGKTSILELIKNSSSVIDEIEILNGQFLWNRYNLRLKGKIEYLIGEKTLKILNDEISFDGRNYKNLEGNGGGSIGTLGLEGLKLLYLSAEMISKEAINFFDQNPLDVLSEMSSDKYSGIQKKQTNNANYIYEFSQNLAPENWFSLLRNILEYRKKFTQMASELIHKGAIADINRLNKRFSEWAVMNVNPLVSFANHINPILKKLNLEVDLINTEYSVPIRSINSEEVIPISNLSTGTKGLLLSMFPLYELDTTDSVILIDEPERSLFPDIQVELMSFYLSLASKAQFIVATHSPFIAAAFEPEERFILYFDENGKVVVRRGESPIGDDPNDLLRNDFNVDYYNEFGKKAYKKYLELKRKLTQENEPGKKKELLIELTELGDKYNF